MNNEEAKFILQGYRPNGADAGDPTFAAALRQAKEDPALGEWFAREQAFDSSVSAKVGAVVPPSGLRAAILAGSTVSGERTSRTHGWNRPAWMSMAAGIAVLLGGGIALWPNRADALTDFALQDSKVTATHGGHGHEKNELQAVLNHPETRLGQPLPVSFAKLHETGCRAVECAGHDVLELCFTRNGQWFHAYIARKADFPQLKVASAPAISDHGGTSMATWADDDHVFVVVSKTGREHLEALL